MLNDLQGWAKGARFMGVRALKNPIDWWVYQELICAHRYDWIVEVGTFRGGSLLSYAWLCEALGHGRVIGVDVTEPVVAHPRITHFAESDEAAFPRVGALVGGGSCLVIEDSSHKRGQCLRVLRSYGTLVKPGGYLIVEDVAHCKGVREALREFLPSGFEVDRGIEPVLTFNPGGYLKKL